MTKSYYCPKLEITLNLLPDEIKYCCSCAACPGITIKNSQNLEKEKIIKTKKQLIEMFKQGIIPTKCRGCSEYKEKKEENSNFIKKLIGFFYPKETKKISHLIMNHYKQCECKCIYCNEITNYNSKKQNYNALPLIKQLFEEKMINEENLTVEFQGGNVSLLTEFEDIIEELSKNNCKNITILTNGVQSLPAVEKYASKMNFRLCISLDSGTKETFNKIKRIDAFDKVIDNIKKFTSLQNVELTLKYITLNGINDNIDEIKEFLKIAQSTENKVTVAFDIDYRDTFLTPADKFIAPKHYKELYKEVENFCKENNIMYTIQPQLKTVLEKGYYEQS